MAKEVGPLIPLLAGSLVLIFTVPGLFHVAWAFGSRKASGVIPEVNGKKAFDPSPAITLLVAAVLFGCALLIAAVAGWVSLPLPPEWLRYATYALAIAFFARAIGEFRLVGFFKKVRGTSFARLDTWVYSPLCLGISLAAAWLARELFG